MAIMHPSKIYHFNTLSEKAMYEALKEQLPDKYEVFYSVSWHGKDQTNRRINSEADFIIVDREKGFLCLEVKGGVSYIHENDHYVVVNSDGSKIVRNSSAFEQAEKNMYYFRDIYKKTYQNDYQGVYGFVVAFPFYQMKDHATEFFQVPEVIIDSEDLSGNLENTIRRAFLYWQNKNHTSPELFVDSSKKKLCDMFKRNYSIEASKAALIEAKREELDRINSAQDGIINLLSNYQSYAIKGAAGTGKSWIAFKLALTNCQTYRRKTLLISKSNLLASYFKNQLDIIPDTLEITDLDTLLKRFEPAVLNTLDIKPEQQYTAIIIDEAQDFSDQEALFLRALLSDDPLSRINIFYDDEQTLSEDDEQTPKKFLIESPPYLLTENLRNTKNIYDWAKDRTSLGETSFSNQVDGIEPIHTVFRNQNQVNHYLNKEIEKLLVQDKVNPNEINIIIDNEIYDLFNEYITNSQYLNTLVKVYKTREYKGLESNIVFYIHKQNNSYEYKYVGLTRARFVLYDIEIQQ